MSYINLFFSLPVLNDPPKRIDYVFYKSFDEDGGIIGPHSYVHLTPLGMYFLTKIKPPLEKGSVVLLQP